VPPTSNQPWTVSSAAAVTRRRAAASGETWPWPSTGRARRSCRALRDADPGREGHDPFPYGAALGVTEAVACVEAPVPREPPDNSLAVALAAAPRRSSSWRMPSTAQRATVVGATQLATTCFGKWGVSVEVWPINLRAGGDRALTTRSPASYAEETQRSIAEEVASLLPGGRGYANPVRPPCVGTLHDRLFIGVLL